MEMLSQIVEWSHQFIHIVLHLDLYLNSWMTMMGSWIYVLFFIVIFCETGLVVTPFLPGDSFLFAIGALAASPTSTVNIWFTLALLIVAAVLGDATNYSIGLFLGPKVFNRPDSWLLNKKHLEKTHAFYEKYGGKTIVLARYVPIVRTFAPFVAGIGKMTYSKFAVYNVVGGVSWVSLFLIAGYYFGNLPTVKSNFHIVIVAIILISVLPIVFEWVKARRNATNLV